MPSNNKSRNYDRKRGHRVAVGQIQVSICFSWAKLDNTQGQTIDEWEKEELLSKLSKRLQQIGQYESTHALAQQLIKQYTKIGFPENSKFKEPNHVKPNYWAVIHLTQNSKEVVAGYLEENIFYIVFLDKEHHFWPTDIQSRGKNKR
jgi:hypothetical protein